MTRIDFHSNVNDQLDYACRLVRKALASNNTVMVRHQDETQLSQFDSLLWTFSATDFLPHVALNEGNLAAAKRTPVLLTLASNTNTFDMKPMILINLSDTVPTHFAQFKRLIEVVPRETEQTQTATQAAIQAGRERYRYYQQQGYQLNHTIAK